MIVGACAFVSSFSALLIPKVSYVRLEVEDADLEENLNGSNDGEGEVINENTKLLVSEDTRATFDATCLSDKSSGSQLLPRINNDNSNSNHHVGDLSRMNSRSCPLFDTILDEDTNSISIVLEGSSPPSASREPPAIQSTNRDSGSSLLLETSNPEATTPKNLTPPAEHTRARTRINAQNRNQQQNPAKFTPSTEVKMHNGR